MSAILSFYGNGPMENVKLIHIFTRNHAYTRKSRWIIKLWYYLTWLQIKETLFLFLHEGLACCLYATELKSFDNSFFEEKP